MRAVTLRPRPERAMAVTKATPYVAQMTGRPEE